MAELDREQASALGELELRRAEAESEYRSAVAEAIASSELERAKALYDEAVRVCLLYTSFSGNLYLLNGSQYRVWNGTALTDVGGYRPLVAVSVPPAGGGTALEQINKMTCLLYTSRCV